MDAVCTKGEAQLGNRQDELHNQGRRSKAIASDSPVVVTENGRGFWSKECIRAVRLGLLWRLLTLQIG